MYYRQDACLFLRDCTAIKVEDFKTDVEEFYEQRRYREAKKSSTFDAASLKDFNGLHAFLDVFHHSSSNVICRSFKITFSINSNDGLCVAGT
jgi:hypothetical protein